MKKTILLTLLVPAFTCFGQGLISSYPFNGNANDENGTNNGTVYGATLTEDRFGNPNSAYSFDGVDDYIEVSNSILGNTSTSYSISAWVKLDDLTGYNMIVCDRYGNNSYDYNYNFSISDDSTASFTKFSSSGQTNTKSENRLSTDNWFHYVATYDASTEKMKVYLNGNIEDSTINTVNYYTGGTPTQIGRMVGGTVQSTGGNYFSGTIDNIKFYNTALGSNQISSLYNEGICYQTVTVTDTLIINYNITGYNPIEFANTIKVYPNPTSDQITIDAGNDSFGKKVKIINSSSQEVYNSTISTNQETINLNTWTGSGLYFLHLYDEQGNLIDIKKIVLQ